MDARIDVHQALGLRPGDAHILRNPGGVVTEDEIRALAISQRLFGTEEIHLVHHTDCGMQGFDDEEFRRRLFGETGIRPTWPAYGFRDLERSVRDGIAALRVSPFIRNDTRICGFVYDVETGEVREVA
jgi:carbonic anhydrase